MRACVRACVCVCVCEKESVYNFIDLFVVQFEINVDIFNVRKFHQHKNTIKG